jgi:hypothetical protein
MASEVHCQPSLRVRVNPNLLHLVTLDRFVLRLRNAPVKREIGTHQSIFQLLTKVAYYTKYYDGTTTKQSRELQLGRSYWINSSDLNLLAKVLGMKSVSKSNLLYYYLVIKESLLNAKFRRHLDVKHIIREEDNRGSHSCVIGSGEEYKMEVGNHTAR